MILHHRLEPGHEVAAVLRHTPPDAPWLSTVRAVTVPAHRQVDRHPRTGRPCIAEHPGGVQKVTGQITIPEAGDWVLAGATEAERRTLAGLGFRFAGHVADPKVILNTGNRTGGVEHDPETVLARVNGTAGGAR